MKFSDIPGHEDVKERLRNMADEERIPHALLLHGPAGTGKHALVRAFLQYVGCRNRQNGDSCGSCPSCLQHEAMQHIDTIFSFPYIKKKSSSNSNPTYSSDYLREFIEFAQSSPFMDSTLWLEKLGSPTTQPVIYVEEATELTRRLSFAPNISRYNAVVIWQADKLNEAAANKLLKIIEEPPGEAIIVLTTDQPMNILPTIYSRTQRIKVSPLKDNEVAEWMCEHCDVDKDTAASLAPMARGSITNALQIVMSRDDSKRYLDFFISLMRLAYMRDIASLKEWSQKVAAEKRDSVIGFLEYMARMIRENFVANLGTPALNLMNTEEATFSRNFARFINERNASPLYDAVSVAISDVRANVNAKVVLFDLAITVILLLKQ